MSKTAKRYEEGALTLYSADGGILGELSDADWIEEDTGEGLNFVLAGSASEGTLDTLLQFVGSGHDSVKFLFETNGHAFQGSALLLQPEPSQTPAGYRITVETPAPPNPVIV
jgi:hypothetical protein